MIRIDELRQERTMKVIGQGYIDWRPFPPPPQPGG